MSNECSRDKNRATETKRQGWTRQFTADEPRLSEAVKLYRSLGYEVRLEPAVFDEMSEECKKCLLYQNCKKYKTIYIRHKKRRRRKEEAVIP